VLISKSLGRSITEGANIKTALQSHTPSHGLTGGSNPRPQLDCPVKPGNGDKGMLGDWASKQENIQTP
jgi:hypothetical protein